MGPSSWMTRCFSSTPHPWLLISRARACAWRAWVESSATVAASPADVTRRLTNRKRKKPMTTRHRTQKLLKEAFSYQRSAFSTEREVATLPFQPRRSTKYIGFLYFWLTADG